MGNSPDTRDTSPEINSTQFLRRIHRLDLDAIDSLHAALYPQLYRYAFYSLGERAVSQEIASDAFLKLVGAIRQRAAPADLTAWLLAAAAEQVQERLLAPISASPGAAGSQGGDQARYGTLFRRSLHKISPDQQHFMAQRFSQAAGFAQVAGWLGYQEPQLRSLQFQSLNSLLGALGGKAVTKSDETLERALQVCLQHLEQGSRLDELSLSYPKWTEELRALLEVANFSQYPGGIDPRQKPQPQAGMQGLDEAMQRSRTEMLQAAQAGLSRPQPARLAARLVLGLCTVCLLVACGAALAFGATRSIPGAPLYSAKTGLEQLRLELTIDPSSRLQLAQQYDQRRVQEVQEILHLGQVREVVFSGLLEQNPATGWKVGGVTLLVSPETEIVGDVQPGYSATVRGNTTADGTVQADQLQMRELVVQGELQSLSEFNLQVDGLLVTVTPATIWQGEAAVGQRVVVYLHLPESGLPEGRLVEVVD